MIEIVINYDPATKEFKAYEPQTDTLLITSSLGETFMKLDEFLKQQGLITVDLLAASNITYHIDSYVFLGLIENNVNLLKRLNQAPSGFMISQSRFGISPNQNQIRKDKPDWASGKAKKKYGGTGTFSKSSFQSSNKKFGNNGRG